jgi:acetylglutamate kinase
MNHNINNISALKELFPNIKNLVGKKIVIKCGGSILSNESYLNQITSDIAFLYFFGIKIVIVHGGGNEISEMCKLYNIPTKFINGQRVTSKETMDIVQLSLHGKTNRNLISSFIKNKVNAIGISGQDSFIIKTSKQSKLLGFVGKIEEIDTSFIEYLLSGNYLPVISSIGSDLSGTAYNVNADIAAGEIAGALKADQFVVISDVDGIYKNINDPKSRIPIIYSNEVLKGLEEKYFSEGMIPKLEACITALKNDVPFSHIIDGKIQYSLLLSLLTKQDIGTKVIPF